MIRNFLVKKRRHKLLQKYNQAHRRAKVSQLLITANVSHFWSWEQSIRVSYFLILHTFLMFSEKKNICEDEFVLTCRRFCRNTVLSSSFG